MSVPLHPIQEIKTADANPTISFNEIGGIFDWIDNQIDASNPRLVLIIILVVGMFYFVIRALGGGIIGINDNNEGSNENPMLSSSSILETLLWSIFIVIVLMNGFQYFFNTNITTEISNLLSPNPEITLKNIVPAEPTASGDLGSAPGSKMRKQVFHIPASVYDYDNAKALCQAYGANLANIDQMEEAHRDGAEWCSYGWSDNQMILYPTQKSTWEELQKDPAKKNSCGRPGINGGYMENASMKAGVNCYGPKPDMNESSSKLMANIQNYESGKMIDPLHEARINEMRGKINNIVIAPFNKSAWSLL
jgi:hypothetical protein